MARSCTNDWETTLSEVLQRRRALEEELKRCPESELRIELEAVDRRITELQLDIARRASMDGGE